MTFPSNNTPLKFIAVAPAPVCPTLVTSGNPAYNANSYAAVLSGDGETVTCANSAHT